MNDEASTNTNQGKTVEDLRTYLFATLQGLRDGTVKIDQAAAIANVGQVIVNSAKVENDHLKITGGTGSGFIPNALPALKSGQPRLISPMGNK